MKEIPRMSICLDKEIFGKCNQIKVEALMMKSYWWKNSCKRIILDSLKSQHEIGTVFIFFMHEWFFHRSRSGSVSKSQSRSRSASPVRDNGEEERDRKHVKDQEDDTNRDNENYENENWFLFLLLFYYHLTDMVLYCCFL